MLDSLKPQAGKRWPRGQKFALTGTGLSAETTYREAVQGVRALGRAALDGAQRAWATPLRLEPADGVVLCELGRGRRSIAELARALEDCGASLAEVKAAVDRLTDAGLAEPAQVAPAVIA